jgi:hypothetical protein
MPDNANDDHRFLGSAEAPTLEEVEEPIVTGRRVTSPHAGLGDDAAHGMEKVIAELSELQEPFRPQYEPPEWVERGTSLAKRQEPVSEIQVQLAQSVLFEQAVKQVAKSAVVRFVARDELVLAQSFTAPKGTER